MVRRWSYINITNQITDSNFNSSKRSSNFVTFVKTTYYRKKFTPFTKSARKRWASRKRTATWLFVQAPMRDWASEYLFFRKYMRFYYCEHLFRCNTWVFNFVALRQTALGYIPKNHTAIIASLTKRIGTYFYSDLHHTQLPNYSLTALISAPSKADVEQFQAPATYEPSYSHNFGTLTAYTNDDNFTIMAKAAIDSLWITIFMAQLVSIYKAVILCNFYTLLVE